MLTNDNIQNLTTSLIAAMMEVFPTAEQMDRSFQNAKDYTEERFDHIEKILLATQQSASASSNNRSRKFPPLAAYIPEGRDALGSGELGFTLGRPGTAALEQVQADQSKFMPVRDDKEERKRDTEGDESKQPAPKKATGGIVDHRERREGDEEAREQAREVLNVYLPHGTPLGMALQATASFPPYRSFELLSRKRRQVAIQFVIEKCILPRRD
jgi:hypothetical protein